MNFIFITRRPTPPLFLGGAEITHNFLALELTKQGNQIVFIGSLEDPNFPTTERYNYYLDTLKKDKNVKFLSGNAHKISYEYQGIKCFAYPQKNILSEFSKLLSHHQPNVVITAMEKCSDFIQVARKQEVFTIGWLHSCNKEGMSALFGNPDILFSTSQFILEEAKKLSNISNYLFYPAFHPKTKEIERGNFLTFINPVKEKGADFILKLAKKLPDEKFICVEGWYKNNLFYNKLYPNMIYYPPQQNMEKIWKETRILLVPSIVKEAFGRVIVEANLHKIPVIAHNIGGIPEAIKNSGVLLDNLEIPNWINAIRQIDKNRVKYENQALKSGQFFTRDVVKEFFEIYQKHKNIIS